MITDNPAAASSVTQAMWDLSCKKQGCDPGHKQLHASLWGTSFQRTEYYFLALQTLGMKIARHQVLCYLPAPDRTWNILRYPIPLGNLGVISLPQAGGKREL